jgi:hypothetical protein
MGRPIKKAVKSVEPVDDDTPMTSHERCRLTVDGVLWRTSRTSPWILTPNTGPSWRTAGQRFLASGRDRG